MSFNNYPEDEVNELGFCINNTYPLKKSDSLEDLTGITYNQYTPKTFGSSNFMDDKEILDLGLTQPGEGKSSCPYIGEIQSQHWNGSHEKIYARPPVSSPNSVNKLQEGNGHLMTVAPTRAGKGAGQIVPTLLSCRQSCVILDVKGENYERFAGYRATSLNQRVLRFSPFEKDSNNWNPLMSIRADIEHSESTPLSRCLEEEDSSALAKLLISSSGSESDSFWEEKAKDLLAALLLHVRTSKLTINNNGDLINPDLQHRVRERSMREVTRLIALDKTGFESLLEEMTESERFFIQRVGGELQQHLSGEGKLGLSILAMLSKHLKVWSSERVHQVTYKSSNNPNDKEPAPNDFSFTQLRDNNTSIYLIIPPEHLSEYHSVLRVLVGIALQELKDSFDQESPSVLFILDEFPQLGYMQLIENGLSYFAGYGVRFWFFIQDISQLKCHYKESWSSFFSNTEFKCFFGVNDIETAETVSKMLGKTTVENMSYSNTVVANSDFWNSTTQVRNHGTQKAYTPRPLMYPDEVLGIPRNKQIIFIKGLKPIYCNLPLYFKNEELNELSKLSYSENSYSLNIIRRKSN